MQEAFPISREQRLVCIVGSPRSGTTWLQKLLASHADVRTGQESDLFDMYLAPLLRNWNTFKRPTGRGVLGLACYLTEEEFRTSLNTFMGMLLGPMLAPLEPGQLFVEKTPSHALYLPEILSLLPGTRIIHLVRDPRDVALSMIRASRSWGADWAPATVRDAARMWAQHTGAVQSAADILSEVNFLELRYEELLAAPEAELARTLAFLGLAASAAQIRAMVERNTLAKARAGQDTPLAYRGEARKVTGQDLVVEPEGFAGTDEASDWRSVLDPAQLRDIEEVAGDLMRRFGYPPARR